MNAWEKLKNKRTANIGFISRGNAFREPTPAEIARAIMIESESWQLTKGKSLFKKSEEYKIPFGSGKNLKTDTTLIKMREQKAIQAYIETPPGIEIPKEKTWFEKLSRAEQIDWIFILGLPISFLIIYYVAKAILFMKGN